MTRLEEVLQRWESRAMRPIAYGAGFPDHLILELLQDLRAALAKCSVLEWHPGSEKPEKNDAYLLANLTVEGRPTITGIREFFQGHWDLFPGESFSEWAELPERPGEQRE